MKKIVFSLIALGLALAGFAQTPSPSYKKRPSLGVNFFLNDFQTAELIGKSTVSSVLTNNQWTKIKDMDPGLSLQYFQGLSEHVDFMATLGGSFVKYPFYTKSGVTPPLNSKFLLEAEAAINLKLISDRYFLVPYLTFGIGGSMYAGTYFAAYAPAGAGLQFNLGEGTFLNTQFMYRAAVSNLAVNHLAYSMGIASPITERKETVLVVPPPPPPPAPVVRVVPVDKDGDGINDNVDKCPDVAGAAKYDGCPVPDTDGDGINDDNDKCRTVRGVAKYDGCPIPDTDGDGINDEEDKCKDVAGVARYSGCPVPDRDKDGVNDEEDRCPDLAGTRENSGCPVIKEEILNLVNTNVRRVFFVTGSDKLLAQSFKPLNTIVKILNDDAALKLDIEGHTDITGSDKINIPLSKDRAAAVYNYLVKAGIDASRLTSEGFGSSKPISDNKTAKGRALNRRVAMKLRYY